MAREKPAIGESATFEVVVTDDMLVNLGGRRIHPVYATTEMVRHMEQVGRMLIEAHLQEGEDATGFSIAVTHERPARTGDRLVVVATATRVEDRETEATVQVTGPGGVVGVGTLVQRYIRAGRLD